MEHSKNDEVSIRFYWNNPMTIDQMTDLVYNFFLEFETISPVLNGWCNLGKSRKDALSRKFENSPTYIKKKLLRSYKKEMDERGYSKIGYAITLYKEDIEGNGMSLRISTNDLKGLFTANCKFEYETTDLFDKETLLKILRCIIKHFVPDYGCVQTNSFWEIKQCNHFGWVSYTHNKVLNLGDKYIVEKDETGGNLIYMNHTDKFYDYDRVNDCLALENVLKN